MHTLQDPGFVLAVVESVIILAVRVALNGVGRHAHTSGSAPRSGCHRSRKCRHPGSTCRTKRRRHAYTSAAGFVDGSVHFCSHFFASSACCEWLGVPGGFFVCQGPETLETILGISEPITVSSKTQALTLQKV